MTQRERILAIVVAGLVGLAAVFFLVVEPVAAAFERVADRTAELDTQVNDARVLMDNQGLIEGRWSGYRRAGLRDDEYDARQRAQSAVTDWCEDSRLNIVQLEPARDAKRDEDGRFDEITFRLNTTGTIRSLQRFLEHVSTAPFPLRIVDCTITNRREGEESLNMALTLSTIIQADDEEGPQ